jgi:THO complex subunit 4
MNLTGQPIRLTLMPTARARNPFDSAVMPSRSLADRITLPSGRSRSLSPPRNVSYDEEEGARRGIDRYVPGRRSRSPMPRRRGGRRPGGRRDGGRDNEGGRGGNRRAKKTQEELDAEMEDYFGGGGHTAPAGVASNGTGGNDQRDDDTDMIE